MILIGDKNIPFEEISFIDSQIQINNTKPNSTITFDFNLTLMKYSLSNDIAYGVVINSIKEAIYANALEARYIICEKDLASKLQEIATNYLFDSKILAIIEKDNEIEELALKNIDGAFYKDLLIN